MAIALDIIPIYKLTNSTFPSICWRPHITLCGLKKEQLGCTCHVFGIMARSMIYASGDFRVLTDGSGKPNTRSCSVRLRSVGAAAAGKRNRQVVRLEIHFKSTMHILHNEMLLLRHIWPVNRDMCT
jgi:hypothetical protein